MNFSHVGRGEPLAAKCGKIANCELLAANYANDADCDGAVSGLPFATAKSVLFFFKKEGNGYRPRRDACSHDMEQIRVIRGIRGPQFRQFPHFCLFSARYSQLRSLAPFPA